MDREAWRAVIHGVTKSRTRMSDWTELSWTELNWTVVLSSSIMFGLISLKRFSALGTIHKLLSLQVLSSPLWNCVMFFSRHHTWLFSNILKGNLCRFLACLYASLLYSLETQLAPFFFFFFKLQTPFLHLNEMVFFSLVSLSLCWSLGNVL